MIARAGSGHLGPRLPCSPRRDIDGKCLCHGRLQKEESDSSEILSPLCQVHLRKRDHATRQVIFASRFLTACLQTADRTGSKSKVRPSLLQLQVGLLATLCKANSRTQVNLHVYQNCIVESSTSLVHMIQQRPRSCRVSARFLG